MLQFSGRLDDYLDDSDDDAGQPCLAKCPKCGGMADAVQVATGTDIDEYGEVTRLYETTGLRCQECGHREGDECYDESEYENL